MARDPLAMWWRMPVEVRRLIGSGPYGDTFDNDTQILGKLRSGNRLIRDATGAQVVSSSGAAFPVDTDTIPVGSQARLPSGGWRTVIAEARHQTGTGKTPDYYSIDLD